MSGLRAEFEKWWEYEGQYLRAGGGQYEKTFAYHAYQAGHAAAAPDGWQVVPIEPTDKMVEAMHTRIAMWYNPANIASRYQAKHAYADMLATTPTHAQTAMNPDKQGQAGSM